MTLPFRLFDSIACSLVEPPVDRDAIRAELRERRDVLMEELEKPQAGGMGGG